MTRNYKRKRYHPTPMVRGSWLEEQFLADAIEHQMEHLPGVFIALRLADFYKARNEGRILPEGSMPSSPMPMATQASRVVATPPPKEDSAREEPVRAPEPAIPVVAPKVAETITAKKGDGNFNFFFNDDDDDDDE